MPFLIDTSFLLASLYNKDIYHKRAVAFLAHIRTQRRLVPAPVLGEFFQLLASRAYYGYATQALRQAVDSFEILDLTLEDMRRMHAIMTQYASAEFDYVDSSLMALSERLGLRHIATFDRRDFALFRPRHVDFLELQPA